MPISYPPPPAPFIGGRQPGEPRRLTPPSNPPATDNPPFTRRGLVALLALVALAWQAAPVPAQPRPPAPRPAVADNPPFSSRSPLPGLVAAWHLPPTRPQAAPHFIPG